MINFVRRSVISTRNRKTKDRSVLTTLQSRCVVLIESCDLRHVALFIASFPGASSYLEQTIVRRRCTLVQEGGGVWRGPNPTGLAD